MMLCIHFIKHEYINKTIFCVRQCLIFILQIKQLGLHNILRLILLLMAISTKLYN